MTFCFGFAGPQSARECLRENNDLQLANLRELSRIEHKPYNDDCKRTISKFLW